MWLEWKNKGLNQDVLRLVGDMYDDNILGMSKHVMVMSLTLLF